MVYTPSTGEVADAQWRASAVAAFNGNYIIDGCGTSIGDSTTSIETTVAPGTVRFGNDIIEVTQQTVTHPDGDANNPRVDLVTVDSNGSAGRMTGTPAVADPSDRQFPNTRQPVPPTPTPSDNVVVSAALWVPAGTGSASEMFADYVIPREVMGDGLNDLDLIPGRDLQYVLDNAREGETLVGDRSQQITFSQPLTCSTPNVTIRNINWRFANGTATSNTDDMLTLAADGITVENATLDGNGHNQTADIDGITVKASDCDVRGVEGTTIGKHLVNINGGSTTVADTIISRVTARSIGGDALVVQGTGANRTRAKNIRGSESAQRGTVTVRNGAQGTRLTAINGENQARVIEIEDFGSGNSASAAVNSCWMDEIVATGCDQILNADVSADINHRGFKLFRAGGGGFTSPSPAIALILFNNCQGVRVSDCTLSTDHDDAHSVYIGNTPQARVDHCRIAHQAADEACIRIANPRLASADGNQCRNAPEHGIEIITDSSSSGSYEIVHANDNRMSGLDGSGVRFSESQDGTGTMDHVIVKNNIGRQLGGSIVDSADISGTQVVVKDNMS